MVRPRLLDLFSGAGGSAAGYMAAGFHVTGVDICAQPRYCGDAFVQADALTFPLEGYDAIHASPPCQRFTCLRSMWNSKEHADLLTPTRERLARAGVPWVLENVPGSPLRNMVILCGTMFGLGTPDAELRRHRWFEVVPHPVFMPWCLHGCKRRVIGVYGGHGRDRRRTEGVQDFTLAERRAAMGLDWMTGNELSQAIPPAYTAWLGAHLMRYVQGAA